eukprot:140317-Pyramimonas_sp.AAC.2
MLLLRKASRPVGGKTHDCPGPNITTPFLPTHGQDLLQCSSLPTGLPLFNQLISSLPLGTIWESANA